METVNTIFKAAAEKIADRWFESAIFTPLIGAPVSCDAYASKETEYVPPGFEATTPEKITVVIYRKEQVADSLIDPGATFLIGEITYTVEGPDERDGDILGRLIVKSDEN